MRIVDIKENRRMSELKWHARWTLAMFKSWAGGSMTEDQWFPPGKDL